MANLLLAIIYLAFISLGLPDPLLGAAWPDMSQTLGAQLSWAGGISMTICVGTITSSLLSDRLTHRFSTGSITAFSVGLTALALFGFSIAPNYWVLLAIALPYGLGAGGVDAALNNYVALHYPSRQLNWLHCMWGVGTLTGPMILSQAIATSHGWQMGYRWIGMMQVVITIILIASMPLWKSQKTSSPDPQLEEQLQREGGQQEATKPLGIRATLRIEGALAIFIFFFCYSGFEQTVMLWGSSYMVMVDDIDSASAAGFASLFCIGITLGRFISGFMTMKFSDARMIRIGLIASIIGIAMIVVPFFASVGMLIGFTLIGLGAAPIYPCMLHATPVYFGADKSQAVIGMEMAVAYAGSMIMPPLFGLLGQHITIHLLPWYLIILVIVMILMQDRLAHRFKAARY